MSVNPCAAGPNCPGGNCAGCRGGNLYCTDPRCYPNCPNCNTSTSTTSSNWWIVMIILILAILLLIFLFIIGYDYWNKSKAASEPKSVVVNKHIHSVKAVAPPVAPVASQVMMQQVPSQVVVSQPMNSQMRMVSMPAPPPVVVSQGSVGGSVNLMNMAEAAEPNYLARVPNRVNCEGVALGMEDIPGCGLPSNQQVEGFE